MGCGSSKILAGSVEQNDAQQNVRRSSYKMTADEPAPGAAVAVAAAAAASATSVGDDFYTDIGEVKDTDVVGDGPPPSAPSAHAFSSHPDYEEEVPDELKAELSPFDTGLTSASAEEKLKSYREELVKKGVGTKRQKSSNAGLVMSSSSADMTALLTVSEEQAVHAARRPTNESSSSSSSSKRDKDDGGDTSTLPLLAMGAEGQRRRAEMEGQARADTRTMASLREIGEDSENRTQKNFEANDFDF